MLPLVLIVCGDAGGAAAVAPVAFLLQSESHVRIQILTYHYSIATFREKNLRVEELPDALDQAQAITYLKTWRPVLLLTGTTWGTLQPEKQFIAAANVLGVPSLTVLDYWSNYRERFSDENGNLDCLPDRILVMDAQARAEMQAEGFSEEKLIITGSPYLDNLAETRAAFAPEHRLALRAKLGVESNEEPVVLFVSQPLSELYGTALGYTEQQVLGMLIETLDTLMERMDHRLTLAVRPHPREAPDKFADFSSRYIRMANAAQGEGRKWALASDLVVGMSSVLLLEACYLGRLTVSLQPGLLQSDTLPTNLNGLSLVVYTQEQIKPMLERVWFDEVLRTTWQKRLASVAFPSGATRRVTDLVYGMCQADSMRGKV